MTPSAFLSSIFMGYICNRENIVHCAKKKVQHISACLEDMTHSLLTLKNKMNEINILVTSN